MDKKYIRRTMIEKRNSIGVDEKIEMDRKIFSTFFMMEEYIKCQDICIYIGYGSEIKTTEIIKRALDDKKNVFVPRMKENREMDFIKIENLECLKKNKMGILEPENNLNKVVEKIDLNILPGLAFDLKGGRIGYGGGYYDRYFQNKKGFKNIALCYEFQIMDSIPMEIHDIKYDCLISEKNVMKR